MLTTEPPRGWTLTLCQLIERSNTTLENKQLLKVFKDKYWKRDNIETVSGNTHLLAYIVYMC